MFIQGTSIFTATVSIVIHSSYSLALHYADVVIGHTISTTHLGLKRQTRMGKYSMVCNCGSSTCLRAIMTQGMRLNHHRYALCDTKQQLPADRREQILGEQMYTAVRRMSETPANSWDITAIGQHTLVSATNSTHEFHGVPSVMTASYYPPPMATSSPFNRHTCQPTLYV